MKVHFRWIHLHILWVSLVEAVGGIEPLSHTRSNVATRSREIIISTGPLLEICKDEQLSGGFGGVNFMIRRSAWQKKRFQPNEEARRVDRVLCDGNSLQRTQRKERKEGMGEDIQAKGLPIDFWPPDKHASHRYRPKTPIKKITQL